MIQSGPQLVKNVWFISPSAPSKRVYLCAGHPLLFFRSHCILEFPLLSPQGKYYNTSKQLSKPPLGGVHGADEEVRDILLLLGRRKARNYRSDPLPHTWSPQPYPAQISSHRTGSSAFATVAEKSRRVNKERTVFLLPFLPKTVTVSPDHLISNLVFFRYQLPQLLNPASVILSTARTFVEGLRPTAQHSGMIRSLGWGVQPWKTRPRTGQRLQQHKIGCDPPRSRIS